MTEAALHNFLEMWSSKYPKIMDTLSDITEMSIMINFLVKYIVDLDQHLVSYKLCLVIENKKTFIKNY